MAEPAGSALHLVSGPTCAGKTVFIEAELARGGWDGVLFPDERALASLGRGGRWMLHYNVLRPYDRSRASLGRRVRAAFGGPFAADRRLGEVLRAARAARAQVHASVLVVPPAELLRRIRARVVNDPLRKTQEAYPQERWAALVEGLDLGSVYAAWLDFLRRREVPARPFLSTGGGHAPLADEAALLRELSSPRQA